MTKGTPFTPPNSEDVKLQVAQVKLFLKNSLNDLEDIVEIRSLQAHVDAAKFAAVLKEYVRAGFTREEAFEVVKMVISQEMASSTTKQVTNEFLTGMFKGLKGNQP